MPAAASELTWSLSVCPLGVPGLHVLWCPCLASSQAGFPQQMPEVGAGVLLNSGVRAFYTAPAPGSLL